MFWIWPHWTAKDFGVQGALPGHPELIDWLATELIARQRGTRASLKQLVLSGTYRQSSHATPQLLEHDPRNRLLSRGPRYRLPAEAVRDNALAISGLLVDHVGGPSVKPYQPAGLWEDVSVSRRNSDAEDQGAGLYRRSMYTFWKRTCPPPAMSAFDAPDRETCVIRRSRTNTPMQALVLLNAPTYVEASRKFGKRVLLHVSGDQERLAYAFEIALSRPPQPEEATILLAIQRDEPKRFAADPIGFAAGDANLFRYVGNSPIFLEDPSGNATAVKDDCSLQGRLGKGFCKCVCRWPGGSAVPPCDDFDSSSSMQSPSIILLLSTNPA